MDLLNQVLTLITKFAIVGGGLWLVWGAIVLAGGLKDKNGVEIYEYMEIDNFYEVSFLNFSFELLSILLFLGFQLLQITYLNF